MHPQWGSGSGGGADDDLARSSLNRDPTGPTLPTRPLQGGRWGGSAGRPPSGLHLEQLLTVWDRKTPPPRAPTGSAPSRSPAHCSPQGSPKRTVEGAVEVPPPSLPEVNLLFHLRLKHIVGSKHTGTGRSWTSEGSEREMCSSGPLPAPALGPKLNPALPAEAAPSSGPALCGGPCRRA